MNKYHQEIISLYDSYAGDFHSKHSNDYIGSSKPSYPISTPESRNLIKNWLRSKSFTPDEYKNLLDSLSKGKSHNEFSAIGKLLEYLPKLRKTLRLESLDFWLDNAEGWAEVDSICQGNFTADEILYKWLDWEKLIRVFSNSKNIHKRRASLVLLTGPVRHSVDMRLSELAFDNIGKLKNESNILITKAVSWLLRDLIKNHKVEVEKYLKQNLNSLSRIAMRETTNKLRSGKKSGKQ